jgi:hypothetical protein
MNVLQLQLLAIRAQAAALIAVIDATVTEEEKPTATVASSPPEVVGSALDVSSCDHPAAHRVSAATMGNLTRAMCGVCGEDVPV